MASQPSPWGNVVVLVLGVGALCAGLTIGASGCSFLCRCDDPVPIELGTYEIVESLERPELVGGVVEVAADRVDVSFTDAQGQDWTIAYTVVDQ